MTLSNTPPLPELLRNFLERQAAAHAAGLGPATVCGEVEPFDAAPAQAIDPALAWQEALAALRWQRPDFDPRTATAPADWPGLVNAQEPHVALALAVGNYPQLVRQLSLLYQESPAAAERIVSAPGLGEWGAAAVQAGDWPRTLLAAGALRLGRHFDAAARLLQHRNIPEAWQPAWANEEAALTWHRGDREAALEMWQGQTESPVVDFNRGMAALFLDRPAEGRGWLGRAVQQLPESDGWHHLGRLYLALCEMRGGPESH